MKLGLFGGSFDPVHHGHLLAARDALEGAGLDEVLFLPAAQAPLRDQSTRTPAVHRLAILKAALSGKPGFGVSDLELRRGGTSYTIDTVRQVAAELPGNELYWIIGADQVAKLHEWREIEALAALVTFLALERPGHEGRLQAEIPGLRLQRVRGHQVELSSTEIRARAAAGQPLDFLLPHKAIAYIRENSLYRTQDT
ncbi:nicotinate-nucleotide adenylyltransferase [Nibricoccus sp. IMCC34717]|uniref:nicotinate-nucleotide adenylyltransferase n=1 Tax=Nibricoccus sp. IMCC34717 TaxID=3034021 RepID=UPI00385091DF